MSLFIFEKLFLELFDVLKFTMTQHGVVDVFGLGFGYAWFLDGINWSWYRIILFIFHRHLIVYTVVLNASIHGGWLQH